MNRYIAISTALFMNVCVQAQSQDTTSQQTTLSRPDSSIVADAVETVVAAPHAARSPGTPGRRLAPHAAARRVVLPATERRGVDVAGGAGANRPLRLRAGYVEPAPAGLQGGAQWKQTENHRWVVAIELTSRNARALRVRFSGRFPPELQLRVYDPETGNAFGPYQRPLLDENGNWWTTIIFGDAIGLEYALPVSDKAPAVRLPRITAIAYNFDAPDVQSLQGLRCSYRDATCYPGYATAASAVALLAVVGDNVSAFCTGALLNREPGDLSPLVMTANHCVGRNGGQIRARATSCIWFYDTPSCDDTTDLPSLNELPRSDGTLLLKRHTSSDWNLLGLFEPPATTAYLGWDASFWGDPASAVGIHHPAGTFKRLNFGVQYGNRQQEFCDENDPTDCFSAYVWYVDWDQPGGTEPGSSGSPILDRLLRVRGTLSGSADCSRSYYGRFDYAFDTLRYYLSNSFIASPCYVDVSVVGDPENAGQVERGTIGNPFNTIREASFAVIAGDNMLIRPGLYYEHFVIRRPMALLKRPGTVGSVIIGR